MTRLLTVSTVAYEGYSFEQAFDEIARLGFSHVEPAYISGYLVFTEDDLSERTAAFVSAAMASSGIRSVAISTHMDNGGPEAVQMMARRIRFTAAIGAHITITNSTSHNRLDGLIRTIEANLPLAEQLGIIIALENPGYGPQDLMTSGTEGAALIRRFNSPFLRMNYDTANALTCTEGAIRPEADIATALPLCAHLHFKNAERLPDRWRYTGLNEGEIDYRKLLAALADYPDLPAAIELPLTLLRPYGQGPARDGTRHALATINAALEASRTTLQALSTG